MKRRTFLVALASLALAGCKGIETRAPKVPYRKTETTRVLLINQTDPTMNGIYTYSS